MVSEQHWTWALHIIVINRDSIPSLNARWKRSSIPLMVSRKPDGVYLLVIRNGDE